MSTRVEALKGRFGGNLAGDFMGGLMAAIVALPICLAFGVASGLGATAGLYGAIATGILAALFGGTPAQCTGPTGPMTVVTAGLVAANPENPSLIIWAIIISGILQILLGKVKAGQLIDYIPYPVISGFMTGIGTIIIILQIHPFFGTKGSGEVLKALIDVPTIVHSFNLQAVHIGTLTLALIFILPRIIPRIPAPLVALLTATLVSLWFSMDLPRIGEIPSGFPKPSLPDFSIGDLHIILTAAITLALLGAIDSLLTSLVMDKITASRHNSDQELVGQGIGNMMSGLIGGLPGAGATMRSVINVKSGGRTHLSGAVHGFILLAVLLGLSKYAALIPLSCLAAILITVGISIVDMRALKSIRRTPKADVSVMLVVLVLTVFVDLIIAVGVGVAMASVLFAKKLSDAKLSKLELLSTAEHLHEMAEELPAEVRESIYTYTFNGPIFFGEAKNFSGAMEQLSQARYIILRFFNVALIDQTGGYALEEAISRWEKSGIKVLFLGLQPHIRQDLDDLGVIHNIDMKNCFDSLEEAVSAILAYELDHSAPFNAGKSASSSLLATTATMPTTDPVESASGGKAQGGSLAGTRTVNDALERYETAKVPPEASGSQDSPDEADQHEVGYK